MSCLYSVAHIVKSHFILWVEKKLVNWIQLANLKWWLSLFHVGKTASFTSSSSWTLSQSWYNCFTCCLFSLTSVPAFCTSSEPKNKKFGHYCLSTSKSRFRKTFFWVFKRSYLLNPWTALQYLFLMYDFFLTHSISSSLVHDSPARLLWFVLGLLPCVVVGRFCYKMNVVMRDLLTLEFQNGPWWIMIIYP